ncbi:MAG: hypothetical protein IH782_03205 [candidate division NC10 bacterium]|nr:hypothetical protein [candidate division NC10 bacterium]
MAHGALLRERILGSIALPPPIFHRKSAGPHSEVHRRAKRQPEAPAGPYGMREMIRAVGEVLGVSPEHLQTPSRNAQIQRGRELLMYVARRHGRASLREITVWLGVRDLSTVSHGVRRVKETARGFRRQLAQVVRRLAHSHIQA